MSVFNQVLVYSFLPVVTIATGGAIGLMKRPGGNIRSLVLHFAAGVVFSVVGVEILPDILKKHLPIMTIIGFTIGVVAMVAIGKLAEEKREKETSAPFGSIPWTLVTAMAVDVLIDGLLLGIGFATGKTEGILLAVALAIEFLSLGMATATELADNRVTNKTSIAVILALAAVFFTSAVLGATLLKNSSHNVMDLVLSFGLSALLFLVTEELLKEAHEEKETVWHTSAFFVGFLAFLILGMYV